MPTKECCRTCKHCCNALTVGGSDTWCRMRQITVHPEVASFAFCHHWTKKAPSLPLVDEKGSDSQMDRQLELDRELVNLINWDS